MFRRNTTSNRRLLKCRRITRKNLGNLRSHQCHCPFVCLFDLGLYIEQQGRCRKVHCVPDVFMFRRKRALVCGTKYLHSGRSHFGQSFRIFLQRLWPGPQLIAPQPPKYCMCTSLPKSASNLCRFLRMTCVWSGHHFCYNGSSSRPCGVRVTRRPQTHRAKSYTQKHWISLRRLSERPRGCIKEHGKPVYWTLLSTMHELHYTFGKYAVVCRSSPGWAELSWRHY